MSAARVPLNFFGIGFGLAGLGEAWVVAAGQGLAPRWVGDAILALSAVAWLAGVSLYLRYAATTRGAFAADLRDSVAGPFASLAVITPMLLAAAGVAPHAATAGRVLVDIFLVLTILLGGWFTGYWIYGSLNLDRLHPGYFLPTVAGGLVASDSAAVVGQRLLAEMMLGLGLICWFILGSMILARLFFRPALPAALAPTMAIEVAPAAVASIAYFALRPGRTDIFAAALAGYGLLMVLAQLPLLPIYLRLRFALSTWAFTFSWAAVASTALLWIGATHPAGHRVYSYLVLGVISVFIGAIAARTGLAISRRQLLPAPAPSAPAAATPSQSVPSPATGQPGVPPVAARPSGAHTQKPTQPLGRG
jgi:tellurite resistance protein